MAAHSVQTEYYSGQGVVLLAEKDGTTGNPLGFTHVGNVSALSLAISVSEFSHRENTTGARGVDLVIPNETNVEVNATFESIVQPNLALTVFGDTTAVASGSISQGVYTAKLGKIFDLGYIKVASVVVMNSAETVTYEVDKNYNVNLDAGSIEVFPTATQTANSAVNNIADDDELHISFNYAAHEILNALTQSAPQRWLRFEGLNTAKSNQPVIVNVFKFSLSPLEELALINDEIAQMSVTGNALADQTRVTGSKYFNVLTLPAS